MIKKIFVSLFCAVIICLLAPLIVFGASPSYITVRVSFEANDEYTKNTPLNADNVTVTFQNKETEKEYETLLWSYNNYINDISIPSGKYTVSAKINESHANNYIIDTVDFATSDKTFEYIHVYYKFYIPNYVGSLDSSSPSESDVSLNESNAFEVSDINNDHIDNSEFGTGEWDMESYDESSVNTENKNEEKSTGFKIGQVLSIIFILFSLAVFIVMAYLIVKRRN